MLLIIGSLSVVAATIAVALECTPSALTLGALGFFIIKNAGG